MIPTTQSKRKIDDKAPSSTKKKALTTIRQALEWFRSSFYLTSNMVDHNDMKPIAPYNQVLAAQEYEVQRNIWEDKMREWKAEQDRNRVEALERGEVYKCERWNSAPVEPPVPLSVAAWTLSQGPLTLEKEQLEPWSQDTLFHIITAAMKDDYPFEPKDGESLTDQVQRILQSEHDMAEMDHKYHPVGMLLSGIVMRGNANWLSDSDLDKMAIAHGSDANDRKGKLEDIYRSQATITREFVDKHHDMGEDARGYCSARGILEDSKLALGLVVLPEERPNQRDRNKK